MPSSIAPRETKQVFIRAHKKLWPKAKMTTVIRAESMQPWQPLIKAAREAKLYSMRTVDRDIANGLRRVILAIKETK